MVNKRNREPVGNRQIQKVLAKTPPTTFEFIGQHAHQRVAERIEKTGGEKQGPYMGGLKAENVRIEILHKVEHGGDHYVHRHIASAKAYFFNN